MGVVQAPALAALLPRCCTGSLIVYTSLTFMSLEKGQGQIKALFLSGAVSSSACNVIPSLLVTKTALELQKRSYVALVEKEGKFGQ